MSIKDVFAKENEPEGPEVDSAMSRIRVSSMKAEPQRTLQTEL